MQKCQIPKIFAWLPLTQSIGGMGPQGDGVGVGWVGVGGGVGYFMQKVKFQKKT